MLDVLFRKPLLTVAGVRQTIETSYPAANNLVARLVEAGILTERTGRRRNRVFSYDAFLRIFVEGPGTNE